jgi:penicillin amidase
VRRLLEAYAAGVNAYIAHHAGARQPYYDIVGRPETWRPVDTLVIGKIFALYLSQNFRREIEHARVAKHVTSAQLEALFPPRDRSDFEKTAELAPVLPQLPLDELAAAVPAMVAQPDASNDWVVDGRHSETGKPILENDPHLSYTAPSIWYLARVAFGDLTLTGGMIPGTPFLVVGHNGHVGWGFTETGSDVEDLFVEKIDPDPTTISRRTARGPSRPAALGHGRGA